MKSEMDIARAHDILVGILLGEVPVLLSDETKRFVHAACDVLCWVLEHRPEDCPSAFQDNLKKLEAAAAERGFLLRLRGGKE